MGPNRQWHAGDHGPSAWADRAPHAWCRESTGKPQATTATEPANFPALLAPRMGRDPHDNVTLELPLEVDAPIPDDIVIRIAAGMYLEADDEIPWLLMLLKAAADSENVLKP